MAKSQNGMPEADNSGSEKTETAPVALDVYYSTPNDGDTVEAVFALANAAQAIGHRTYANVPFKRLYNAGDAMTAAQAAFLSANVIRNSLGNDDYASLNDAAAVTVRDIPTQYSLLQDAVDNVVKGVIERKGGDPKRRVDREAYVAQFIAASPNNKLVDSETTIGAAISAEIARLINERKTVKGKAAETGKVELGALFTAA